LTTTWQRFTFSATVPTNATQIATGLSFTPTGTAGTNDYFEVTGVQLEIASAVSSYSPNASTYALELAACQRYFYRATDAANALYNADLIGVGQCTTTTAAQVAMRMPVTMRTNPSLTISAAGDFYAIATAGGIAGTVTAISSGLYSKNSVRLDVTSSSLVAGQATQLQTNTSAAYLQLSAEL
jgi:hypothetical protein